jgi:hypothetical protein
MLLADLPPPLKPYIRCLWKMDVGPGEQVLPGWIAPDGQVEIVFHTGATTSARSFGTSEWVCQPRPSSANALYRPSWLAADVLEHDCEPDSVGVWHDRAVFHLLTGPRQRHAYVGQVLRVCR